MNSVAQNNHPAVGEEKDFKIALKTVSFSAYLIPFPLSNFLIFNLVSQVNQIIPKKGIRQFPESQGPR